MKKLFIPMMLPLILTACGATESLQTIDESLTDSTVTTPAVIATASPYNLDNEAVSIAAASSSSSELNQITIQPSFEFESHRNIDVVIDISELGSSSNYLNICTQFESTGETYQVDYDSCILKTRMDGGYYSGTLTLPNQHDSLLAVVWPSEPGSAPVYRRVALAKEG